MPAPMLYRELPATPKLQSVVASFWEFSANESTPLGHMHSIPVDGCVSIAYVRPMAGPIRVVFVGPRIHQLQVPIFPGDRIWGARFLPGASFAGLGRTGAQWRDQMGLLDFHLPALATEIREHMSDKGSLEEASGVYSSALKPGVLCPITACGVLAITKSRGNVRVADLPAVAGVSERQFLRRFREEVGLTPKQFARICRFRAAAIAALQNESANWGEIAADSGFADQAHLTHEFQALFGVAPREFESGFLANIEHGSLQTP